MKNRKQTFNEFFNKQVNKNPTVMSDYQLTNLMKAYCYTNNIIYYNEEEIIKTKLKLPVPEKITEIALTILKEYNNANIKRILFNQHQFEIMLNEPAGMVIFYFSDNSILINYYGADKDFILNFKEKFKNLLMLELDDSNAGIIFALTQNGQNIQFSRIGSQKTKLEWDNYSEKVVNDVKHIIEDLKKKEPCGRLSILAGHPGCGKTFLVRGILNEVKNCLFTLVSRDLVSGTLNSPSLLSALIDFANTNKNKTIVFIVEDADDLLVKRMADNMNAISSILNLSDGILGNLLDVRIICTTNAEIMEIDSALLRNGRLCRMTEVTLLDKNHANKIASKILNKDYNEFTESKSLADIYKIIKTQSEDKDKEEKIKPVNKKQKIGFCNEITIIN
jgi:hypothetical protein